MEKIKLGAVNMHVKQQGYEVNRKKMLDFIEQAASEKIDFLVFPEVALQGYMDDEAVGSPKAIQQKYYFRKTAETVPGPFCDSVQELARKYQMYVQVGMAEKCLNGDVLYNSAVIVGPQGVEGIFRKLHNQFEFSVFNPGDDLPVFNLPIGKVGPFICYDLAFPEVNRVQALKGAQILSLTTAWPMQGRDMENDHYGYCYDIMSRSNAMFNMAWMVSSNHAEKRDDFWYYGHSRIISPDGYIIAELVDEEGIASAEVDVEGGVDKSRTSSFFGLSLIQDRRPEFYSIISDKDAYYRFDAEHASQSESISEKS